MRHVDTEHAADVKQAQKMRIRWRRRRRAGRGGADRHRRWCLVTATVAGTGELKSIKIDPKAVDPEDVETLETGRRGRAQRREAARVLTEQKMGPVAGAWAASACPFLSHPM